MDTKREREKEMGPFARSVIQLVHSCAFRFRLPRWQGEGGVWIQGAAPGAAPASAKSAPVASALYGPAPAGIEFEPLVGG